MPNTRIPFHHLAAVLIAGACIGAMIGLSISPVVHLVLPAVLTLAVTVASVLAGVDREADASKVLRHVNPLPICLLTFGMLVGSGFGVFARTNGLLQRDLSSEVRRWEDIGVPDSVVRERLLRQELGDASITAAPAAATVPTASAGDRDLGDKKVGTANIGSGVARYENAPPFRIEVASISKPVSASAAERKKSEPERLGVTAHLPPGLYSKMSESDCNALCKNSGRALRANAQSVSDTAIKRMESFLLKDSDLEYFIRLYVCPRCN